MPSTLTPLQLAERIYALKDPFAEISLMPIEGLEASALERRLGGRRQEALSVLIRLMEKRPVAVARREELSRSLHHCRDCGVAVIDGQITIYGALSPHGLGFGLDYSGELFIRIKDEMLLPCVSVAVVHNTVVHLLTHHKLEGRFNGGNGKVSISQEQFNRLASLLAD